MAITRDQLVGLIFESCSIKYIITRIDSNDRMWLNYSHKKTTEWENNLVKDALNYLNNGRWKLISLPELSSYELWV